MLAASGARYCYPFINSKAIRICRRQGSVGIGGLRGMPSALRWWCCASCLANARAGVSTNMLRRVRGAVCGAQQDSGFRCRAVEPLATARGGWGEAHEQVLPRCPPAVRGARNSRTTSIQDSTSRQLRTCQARRPWLSRLALPTWFRKHQKTIEVHGQKA